MAAVTADTSLFGGDRHYQNDPSAPAPRAAPGAQYDQLEAELFGAGPSLELGSGSNVDTTTYSNEATRRLNDGGSPRRGDLGIDEEVVVRKQRKPVPKLDEERLLGPKGLPKLRTTIDKKLRFKGKGHEFSDVGRLLNLYQLWLDDLFPKAKFADGLTMIEKLGHKSRVQVTRKEWLEDGKRKATSADHDSEMQEFIANEADMEMDTGGLFVPESVGQQVENERRPIDELREEEIGVERMERNEDSAVQAVMMADSLPLEDDELDDLLAEERSREASSAAAVYSSTTVADDEANFDDDEEAIAALGW